MVYKSKYLKYKIKYLALVNNITYLNNNDEIAKYFQNIYVPEEYKDLLADYDKYFRKEKLPVAQRKYIYSMALADIPIEIDKFIVNVKLPDLYFYNNVIVALYKENFGTFVEFINKYITSDSNVENISCLFKQLFFYHFVSHNKLEYRNFMLFIKPSEINPKYQKMIETVKLTKQPHITVVQKCSSGQNPKSSKEKIFLDTIYLLFYWSVILDKYHMSCHQYYNFTQVGDYFDRTIWVESDSHSRIVLNDVSQMVEDINDFVVKENLSFCRPYYDTAHMKDQLTKKNNESYNLVTYFYDYHDNKINRYVDYGFRLSSVRFVKNMIDYGYDIPINELILRLFYNSEFLFVFDNANANVDVGSAMYSQLLFIDESYIKNQKSIIPKILDYVSLSNIYNFSCIYKHLYNEFFRSGDITYTNFVSKFGEIFNVQLPYSPPNNNSASFIYLIQIMLYWTYLLDKHNYKCDDISTNKSIHINHEIVEKFLSFLSNQI
jgi:hypothetical protein